MTSNRHMSFASLASIAPEWLKVVVPRFLEVPVEIYYGTIGTSTCSSSFELGRNTRLSEWRLMQENFSPELIVFNNRLTDDQVSLLVYRGWLEPMDLQPTTQMMRFVREVCPLWFNPKISFSRKAGWKLGISSLGVSTILDRLQM